MNATETLTTTQLAERWRVTRSRVWQRAEKYPDLLHPEKVSHNVTYWSLVEVHRFEREILGFVRDQATGECSPPGR